MKLARAENKLITITLTTLVLNNNNPRKNVRFHYSRRVYWDFVSLLHSPKDLLDFGSVISPVILYSC